LNVLDKHPKRLHAEVRKKLRAPAEAPTRLECARRRDTLSAWLRGRGQAAAAACRELDWEDFVSFYAFPEEHWMHDQPESTFSGVRLRTNASKRLRVPENALYLVFKLVLRLSSPDVWQAQYLQPSVLRAAG
jgi:transposase-like protein